MGCPFDKGLDILEGQLNRIGVHIFIIGVHQFGIKPSDVRLLGHLSHVVVKFHAFNTVDGK
jgi:hypothetical protein